jgi:hypothetical protein
VITTDCSRAKDDLTVNLVKRLAAENRVGIACGTLMGTSDPEWPKMRLAASCHFSAVRSPAHPQAISPTSGFNACAVLLMNRIELSIRPFDSDLLSGAPKRPRASWPLALGSDGTIIGTTVRRRSAMNPVLRSGIMGVVGFVLFALVWISLLVEDFATPHEAVSLDIYRNELTHNPLFWWLAFVSGTVFAIVSHIAARSRREHDKAKRTVRLSGRDSASFG